MENPTSTPFTMPTYLEEHVAPADRDLVRTVRARARSTLERARAGEVRLDELDVLPPTPPTNEPAALVLTSIVDSVRAYLHYKERDFDLGIAALERAFAADLALEADGLVLLAAHRTQLVVNRMQVSLRRGDIDEAVAIGGRVQEAARTGSYTPLGALPPPWSERWPGEIPAVVLEPIRALAAVVERLLERDVSGGSARPPGRP
jgi:hypothetical protein